MKRFFILILLLAAGIVGLGFYLGWFQFSTDSTGQKTNITLTTDRDRIEKDTKKAVQEVQKTGQAVRERIGGGTEKSKDEP